MTRIDFYILADSDPAIRVAFACRLIQKTLKLGHRIYVHCDHQSDAEHMDKQLWRFNDCSFIAHRLLGSGGADCPVEIGFGEDPGEHHDILVNLGLSTPSFFSRFVRVAEIVSQEPKVLAATRLSYKNYAAKNYPLHRHDLRK